VKKAEESQNPSKKEPKKEKLSKQDIKIDLGDMVDKLFLTAVS